MRSSASSASSYRAAVASTTPKAKPRSAATVRHRRTGNSAVLAAASSQASGPWMRAVDAGRGDGEGGECLPQVLQPPHRLLRPLHLGRADGGGQGGGGQGGRRLRGQGAIGVGRLPGLVTPLPLGFLGQALDDRPHVHGLTVAAEAASWSSDRGGRPPRLSEPVARASGFRGDHQGARLGDGVTVKVSSAAISATGTR